jgi:hypothetical protein
MVVGFELGWRMSLPSSNHGDRVAKCLELRSIFLLRVLTSRKTLVLKLDIRVKRSSF